MARDYDGKVTPEEVASAASYLKATLDKEGIQEFISKLSKDRGQLCYLSSPMCPNLIPPLEKNILKFAEHAWFFCGDARI